MKIGYVRVSTEEQNEAKQEILMKQLGAVEAMEKLKRTKPTFYRRVKAYENLFSAPSAE